MLQWVDEVVSCVDALGLVVVFMALGGKGAEFLALKCLLEFFCDAILVLFDEIVLFLVILEKIALFGQTDKLTFQLLDQVI